MDKIELLNGGFRKDLASRMPALARLEQYCNLIDLRIVDVDTNKDRPEVVYEAGASSWTVRRLKSSLVEAGVITNSTPTTQTYMVSGKKHMRMYFWKENLAVELRVKKIS